MFFTLDRFRHWLTRHLCETSLSAHIMQGRGHCPHSLGRGRQQDWGGTLITFKSFLCGYPSSQLWRRVQQVEADGQCATSVCRPREFGWLQMRLYKFLQDSTQHIITTTFRGFVVELSEGFMHNPVNAIIRFFAFSMRRHPCQDVQDRFKWQRHKGCSEWQTEW